MSRAMSRAMRVSDIWNIIIVYADTKTVLMLRHVSFGFKTLADSEFAAHPIKHKHMSNFIALFHYLSCTDTYEEVATFDDDWRYDQSRQSDLYFVNNTWVGIDTSYRHPILYKIRGEEYVLENCLPEITHVLIEGVHHLLVKKRDGSPCMVFDGINIKSVAAHESPTAYEFYDFSEIEISGKLHFKDRRGRVFPRSYDPYEHIDLKIDLAKSIITYVLVNHSDESTGCVVHFTRPRPT